MSRSCRLLFAILAIALNVLVAGPVGATSNTSAEFLSPDQPAAVEAFKLRQNVSSGYLRLDPVDSKLIEDARSANASGFHKRLQIGVARSSGAELVPAWTAVEGGYAAQWTVTSPAAEALRLEVSVQGAGEGAQLRFSGLGELAAVYLAPATDFADKSPSRWSPVLPGETAIVELFVKAIPASPATIAIDQVSHIFAAPWDSASIAKASGSCEVDFICRAASDAALASIGRAVAKMTFSDGGSSYLCTGTLLNPTGAAIAYFYSANHCISTQAVASTLTTHWFYDRTGCGSGSTSSSYVQVTGGATLLYANATSDALLLRLNSNPPSGAVLAGWDSNTIGNGVAVTAVHHPVGDWKKVSLGTVGGFGNPNGPGTNFIKSNWNSTATGVTEGGSSGSGLFTNNGSAYIFRGGLYGGPSSCTASAANLHDFYSRFDQVYPSIAQYLNPATVTCTYTLSPTTTSVSAAGTTGTFSVTASAASCGWSASSDSSWLTTSSSGTGSGTVSYTVASNSGGARSGTITVAGNAFTVTQQAPATGGVNVLGNPGFESGTAAWSQSASGGYPIIWTDGANARTGSAYAWLGGYDSGTDTLYQTLTIPSGGTTSLRFWYKIGTNETTSSTVYDSMTVTIANASTGATLATLTTLSNLNSTGGNWVQSSAYDVSAYAGQAIRLVFKATMDFSNITNFFVDDIALTFTQGAASSNYQGLWYKSPAESESGWGLNVAHQADTIFATWFTYDTSGRAWWLSMTANKTSGSTYTGSLIQTGGPAFFAVPFNPGLVTRTTVGTGTLTFSDASNGTFSYTVNGVTQSKAITRQVFGTLPSCTYTASPSLSAATNYQDLWWVAAGAESGWGINFTHQSNTIFATWFTYDSSGAATWVSATLPRTAAGVYSGQLIRTAGPAFSAVPFNPALVTRTPVGTMTVTFGNGNSATMAYTLDGVTQTKTITRQLFYSPAATVCQ
jgi:lysyl endopeptidase